MTEPTVTRRPGTITLVAVLAVIGFLHVILSGIMMIADADTLAAQLRWGVTDGQLVISGVVAIAIGVIGLALTAAFSRGSNVVRILFAVWVVLQIVAGLYSMRLHADGRPGLGIVSVVVGIVILFLLFNSRADDYFARD